jgi:hypothetical protein
MVINLSSLPQETIEKYDFIELSHDGKVYIEIQKGMYGLPHAGILSNELLQRNLAKDGYQPTQHTHGLWTHDTCPISFLLLLFDIYFNCAYALMNYSNLNSQAGSQNTWRRGVRYCGRPA